MMKGTTTRRQLGDSKAADASTMPGDAPRVSEARVRNACQRSARRKDGRFSSMSRPNWGIVALIAAVCAFGGGVLGFIIGVATSEFGKEMFSGFDMAEEDADVRNPASVDRAAFEFQYPGNWVPDPETPYYDIDHYVYIETPGGSYVAVTFEEFNSDPQETLVEQLVTWEDYLKNSETVYFDTYGSFQGQGVYKKGRTIGASVSCRIFCYSEGEKTLVVTEFAYETDRDMLQPGFDLIERTLKLK